MVEKYWIHPANPAEPRDLLLKAWPRANSFGIYQVAR